MHNPALQNLLLPTKNPDSDEKSAFNFAAQSSFPRFSSIKTLEAQAAHILLEAAAISPTALMFSGGKDSACIAHIIRKLFKDQIPFAFFHYDSGDNFPEVLSYRDNLAREYGAQLRIFDVNEYAKHGLIKTSLDGLGNVAALVELINYSQNLYKLKGLIGGGRRDEDPVRAKERIFSLRESSGKWEPSNQRPELWDIYNAQLGSGNHLRIFPLSNFTERNVWEYIAAENVPLPSIYFAHERQVVRRNNQLLAYIDGFKLRPEEKIEFLRVRCRTVGDQKTTGFIESSAENANQVLEEIIASRWSERAGRAEELTPQTAMEARKTDGWF